MLVSAYLKSGFAFFNLIILQKKEGKQMKKLLTLVLALGMVLGTVTASQATDIRFGGQMDFTFGKIFHPGLNENNHADFLGRQRIRTWVDFIVSEQLKGQLYFEIGETNWGNTGGNNAKGQGFSMGGDGVGIEVRRAYLDWLIPNTKVQLRMGLQGIAFPMSQPQTHTAIDDDMAGIVMNYKFNDNVAMTALWAVPYEGDSGGFWNNSTSHNDMHLFGLILPITGNGFKVVPYAAYAMMGDGVSNLRAGDPNFSYKDMRLVPGGKYDYAWWAGVAVTVTAMDPFVLFFDAIYSDLHSDVNDKTTGTEGYWLRLGLDYKASWGTPGAQIWYASGDDDDELGQLFKLSGPGARWGTVAFDDSLGLMNGSGNQLQKSGLGTWGVMLQIKDISFIEKMKHTVRATYIQGTNDKSFSGAAANTPQYLTTKDWGFEVDFLTRYEIYDNLTAFVEFGVLWVDMDDSAKNDTYDEPTIKAQFGFQFRF